MLSPEKQQAAKRLKKATAEVVRQLSKKARVSKFLPHVGWCCFKSEFCTLEDKRQCRKYGPNWGDCHKVFGDA